MATNVQNKQKCCIERCLSNSLRIKNITFHSMPKEKLWFDTWVKTIRRNVINFVPSPDMKVCSIHFHRSSFESDGELRSQAAPMYFPILHDVRCCVQGCSSRQSTNQIFQKFPKDDALCAQWAEAIEKHNGHPVVQNASYVCSMHFASDPGPNAVPTIFPTKPSYWVAPVARIRTPTAEDRQATPPASTSETTAKADPPEAKKPRHVEEIIILDDDDDDDAAAQPNASTSNDPNAQKSAEEKIMNLPIRLLHKITQLRNDNAKTQREINVMKRKYMELKKRCETLEGLPN